MCRTTATDDIFAEALMSNFCFPYLRRQVVVITAMYVKQSTYSAHRERRIINISYGSNKKKKMAK